MNYGNFNVRTDVNARDCALGCTDTVRESAQKVDSVRKIPCRTGESNLRRQRAGPMLYQLSYIHVRTLIRCPFHPPVLPQWHVKDSGHSAKSAGGRLHLNTHTPLTQKKSESVSYTHLTLPTRIRV